VAIAISLGFGLTWITGWKQHRANDEAEQQLRTSQAPRLIITYHNPAADWERLAFSNEGKTTAITIRPGALVHEERSAHETKLTIHEVTMIPEAIPAVAPGATGEGKIFAEQSPSNLSKLVDILRRGGPHSSDSVTFTFEDGERHKFEQRFALTVQSDGGIRCDPGPVVAIGRRAKKR